MKYFICKDNLEASKLAFEALKTDFDKENVVLGLATGSTPLALYQEIIKFHQETKFSFQDLVTVNLDEYIGIATEHPESYHSFMYNNLFKYLDINLANTHLPSNDASDLDKNCQEYNDLLNSLTVNTQILGIGANGHIGFNEPGTSFESTVHIVPLQEKTIKDNARFFDGNEDLVPKEAITMGIKNIMAAERIILLAFGKNKAQAVKEMIEGEVVEAMPASILQRHPNVLVFLDEDAASLLKKAS